MRQKLYGCDVYIMYHQSAIDNASTNRDQKAHQNSTMVSAMALVKEEEVTLDGDVANAFLEHF